RRRVAWRARHRRAGGRGRAVQPGGGDEEQRGARAVPPGPAVLAGTAVRSGGRAGPRAGADRRPVPGPDPAPVPGGGGVRRAEAGGDPMSRSFRGRPAAPDGVRQHREWLSLVEVAGPFLSLPVLRSTWPTLDPLDRKVRERLRVEHATWLSDPARGQRAWLGYALRELLGWGDELREAGLDKLAVEVAEHDTRIAPSFALVEPGAVGPGAVGPGQEVKPDAVRLLGLVCPPGTHPGARVAGSAWSATYADRLAHLCRRRGVELGLATDGRWW